MACFYSATLAWNSTAVDTRGIPGILCYGKRVMARRMGLRQVFDRAPAEAPTGFGLAEMERLYAEVTEAEATLLPRLQARLAAMR